MAITLTEDDHAELERHIGRFFRQTSPLVVDRDHDRVPVDRELHQTMAELGFFTQALPTSVGGLDLGVTPSILIAEAAGHELVNGPWLDQLVVCDLLARCAPDQLEPYATGSVLASVAFTGQVLADRAGDLRGAVTGVRFGADVDAWCIVTPEVSHFVASDAETVRLEPELSCDPSWTSFRVDLGGTTPLLTVPHGRDVGDGLERLASALAAVYSVAAADRVLTIAVDYVKQRRQFGVQVGSFQAVKHRAANCYVELLHARSLARAAARTLDRVRVDAACVVADEAYRRTAESALQMHGGVGFTREVPVHRFVKNAQQLRAWPRSASTRLDALRAHLALDRPEQVPA